MKIIFITGDHPRHAYISRALAATGYLHRIVIEQREPFLPEPPSDLAEDLTVLFDEHFARRDASEARHFGPPRWPDVSRQSVSREELNGSTVRELLIREAPDLLLSYGCHILSDDTLACAPGQRWNIHGGLSPWYKGSITHFWPSYLLEPQMTGMTVHELTKDLDAGAVVHQCVADLVRGDGLHDLACRAVLKLADELPALVSKLAEGKPMEKLAHKTSGRLWRSTDWRPEHLRVIYQQYGDRIVDCYLEGKLAQRQPVLHRQV